MLWFDLMNPTDILVLITQFSQPRATLDILPCFRADPDIIDILTTAYRYEINPLNNVISPFLIPEMDIPVGSVSLKGVTEI